MRTFARWLLAGVIPNAWARVYLWVHRPTIVAVTGNVGKTTTKDAIAAVLASAKRVRATGGNLNNPSGVPLAILGGYQDAYYRMGGTLAFWLMVCVTAPFRLFARPPQVLVLEYGADMPGDIKRLVSRFRPHVSVVTPIGQVPVHVEYFASAQDLANEKMQIVKCLGVDDHAVLAGDDLTVLDMREHTRAHVHTYGLAATSQVRASDVSVRMRDTTPTGISFNLSIDGHNTMSAAINGTLGSGVASAAAAATAVGAIFGIGLAQSVQALSAIRAPQGRMRILEGIKNSVLIDDTYNSSPAAARLALDTVRHLPGRKVVVLGDMLELGEHSVQAHQSVGDMVGDIAGELIVVGERARFIADSAANQMPAERIHRYEDSVQAAEQVHQYIQPGDVVLMKGSQGMRMERVTQALMAHPEQSATLLVRQSARWRQK